MKRIISPKHLSTLIFLLSIVVGIKILWLVVSMLFLPNTGEELQQVSKAKKLYYRVRLTNESKVIAPVKSTKVVTNTVSSMRGYKLLGLYSSKEVLVVTVAKGRKTEILSKGEKTNGFELILKSSILHWKTQKTVKVFHTLILFALLQKSKSKGTIALKKLLVSNVYQNHS